MKLGRPQTAPHVHSRNVNRPVSVQEQRPLGRMPRPLLRPVAQAAAASPASVLAAIKSDIFSVLQKRDALAAEFKLPSVALQMQSMEKQLASLTSTPGAETFVERSTLLETLLHVMSGIATDVLGIASDEASLLGGGGPLYGYSRADQFLQLIDFTAEVARRKKMWTDRSSAVIADGKSAAVQYDAADTVLDMVLNEPTVSELRKLIDEQKQLHSQMKEMLPESSQRPKARQTSTPPPPPKVEEKKAAPPAQTAAAVATVDYRPQLDALTKEKEAMVKRIAELESTVKKLEDEARANLEDMQEASAKIQSVAFSGIDVRALEEFGCSASLRHVPTEIESALAAKINQTIDEAAAENFSGFDEKTKSKKRDGSGTPAEGAYWFVIRQQNQALQKLLHQLSGAKNENAKELKNLQQRLAQLKSASSLQERRSSSAMSQASRDIFEKNAALIEERNKNAELRRQLDAFSAAAKSKGRIVNVKGQLASAAEREDALQQALDHRSQCVTDLTQKLAVQKEQLQQEQVSSAITAKERQSLLMQLAKEERKNAELLATIEAKNAELLQAKDGIHLSKKELREKASSEADLQQRVWKLEVELHIAQNVLNDLRSREEDLIKRAREAQACQFALRESSDKERETAARKIAFLEDQLHVAQSNQRAAEQSLRDERARMIQNEREVERLKTLDVQMESLEMNFTNYAASKLAQREANEEEEKTLQACINALERNVFELPAQTDAQDQVTLFYEHLKSKKLAMENEERVRRRALATSITLLSDGNSKKHLISILQQRFNAAQMFACEQRLRQIACEKETEVLRFQLEEIRSQHETSLQENSLAKVQCESLLQRNTELEIERSQLMRNRASAELEIKNLKASLHRMKTNHEEQEKILVEVGTRLQNSRLSSQPSDIPLGPVIEIGQVHYEA